VSVLFGWVITSATPRDSDPSKASTSIVERSNLSLRMGNRRFTRFTNAVSKKLETRMHAVSFYFMVYNFAKIHKSIKTTPAMEAGVTNFLWSMEDIVMMGRYDGAIKNPPRRVLILALAALILPNEISFQARK
jgi:hypothetical protein